MSYVRGHRQQPSDQLHMGTAFRAVCEWKKGMKEAPIC
jgi:hypothetical protein